LEAASVADYSMYFEQGLVWDEQNLDKWISNPKAMIPDSPMALAFQGIPDAGERKAGLLNLVVQNSPGQTTSRAAAIYATSPVVLVSNLF
jgi:cytochrome c2